MRQRRKGASKDCKKDKCNSPTYFGPKGNFSLGKFSLLRYFGECRKKIKHTNQMART